MQNTYAANIITNLYFISGKGFVAKTTSEATPLTSSEVAVIRASFLNVKIVTEPKYNNYTVTINKGATVKVSARSHSHARSTVKHLFGMMVTSVRLV